MVVGGVVSTVGRFVAFNTLLASGRRGYFSATLGVWDHLQWMTKRLNRLSDIFAKSELEPEPTNPISNPSDPWKAR